MVRNSFRGMIITGVFIVYLIFTGIMFIVFNNVYYESFKQKFITENNYSAKVAKEMLEEEKQKLITDARIVAKDELIYQAFENNIYIGLKWDVKNKKIATEFPDMSRLNFIQVANLEKKRLYGMGGGSELKGVALYKYNEKNKNAIPTEGGNLFLAGSSADFSKKFLDEGNEDYLKVAIGIENLGGVEMGFIQEKENEFFLKGASPINRNINYNADMPLGLVVIGEKLDGILLEKISSKINRELMLIKGNEIITSTLYKNTSRVQGIEIDFSKLNDENDIVYAETVIEKRKMGVTLFPILDYNKKIIAYLGTGFDLGTMDQIYRNTLKQFIVFEVLFGIVLFIVLFYIISLLFKPFNEIIEGLKHIMKGEYDKKIKMQSASELKVMIESVNNLAEAVKEREKELIYLNLNLESKVTDRTRELNQKNSELEKINRKIEEEIAVAKKVHSKVVTFDLPKMDGFNIFSDNVSINGLGGDFIDVITLNDGRKGVVFADVAGHGVGAALMVSALKIIIHIYFKDIKKPSEALYLLNDLINETFIEGITVSCVYLIVDEKRGIVEFSSGAQENMLLVKNTGIKEMEEKGIILGVLRREDIESNKAIAFKNTTVELQSGEKLFLFTDGLVENEVLDREKLLKLMDENRKESAERIFSIFLKDIKPKIEEEEIDDFTYIILEKK